MENETIERVFEQVESLGYTEPLQAHLRGEFPRCHFTFCDEDDIHHELPVRRGREANLYLVKKGEHCLSLTDSQEGATGFVVAELTER